MGNYFFRLGRFAWNLAAQVPREVMWQDRMSAYNTMLALYRAGYDEEDADRIATNLTKVGGVIMWIALAVAFPLLAGLFWLVLSALFSSGVVIVFAVFGSVAALWHLSDVARGAIVLPAAPVGHPDETYSQVWPHDFTMHLAELSADKVMAAKAARDSGGGGTGYAA